MITLSNKSLHELERSCKKLQELVLLVSRMVEFPFNVASGEYDTVSVYPLTDDRKSIDFGSFPKLRSEIREAASVLRVGIELSNYDLSIIKLKSEMEEDKKTNIGLVKYCKAQLGRPYWYGTFGNMGTKSLYDAKKKQYPKYYTANDFDSQIGMKVHDCIGLIKGYFWCKDADDMKPTYCANGFKDWSANMFRDHCKRKSNDMSKIPEVPGIAVFMSGHVGVYIGGGKVIEARGHKYGVVETEFSKRKWSSWAYLDELIYEN